MSIVTEMFSFPFMVRALIAGGIISLCAALLGVSLVLKRFSMIGDGLSHVGFGALAIAAALNVAPLFVSIPVVVIFAFLLLRLNEKARIKGDSAIALVSTSALAIGVVILSLTTGMTTDVNNYMFGSILAISKSDMIIAIIAGIVILGLFAWFYHRIFLVTFDESFARASGINTNGYQVLLSILTAVTIVLGMRLMGALLISSLIIFPALTSMQVFKKYSHVIISSGVISIVCFLVGLVLSYVFSLPTGASIVVANMVLFGVFFLIGFIGRKNG